MKPLNNCLFEYLDRRKSDPTSPSWLLFHDTDEYLFPVTTSQAIPEALRAHNNTCCLLVNRALPYFGVYLLPYDSNQYKTIGHPTPLVIIFGADFLRIKSRVIANKGV